MVTVRDIADKTGVSIATVSRVINGSKNVAEETRKKVLKAIKELEYKPRPRFGENGTLLKTLGVIVPNIRAYHYPQIITGIYEAAFQNEFDVMIALAKDKPIREREILDEYFNRKVDGILVCTLKCEEHYIDRFIESGIPVVAVDYPLEEVRIDSVNIDNVMGAYSALRYLYNKGHRKVYFIRGALNVYASRDREYGIKKFLRRHKDMEVTMSHTAGFEAEHGYAAILENKSKLKNFSVVFCSNDYVAMGAIRGLNELKLAIPDEISVMGFDDAPFAPYTVPPLTTVFQPRTEMGTIATQLLIDRLNSGKKSVFKNVVLPTRVLERKTVKKLSKTSNNINLRKGMVTTDE
ncbi:MAG: LacI family transcriptional regulator [Kosmotoga sp.]|nr:MAG: LacI family transcriptional regulator [Kosmotoga sp.]